MVLLLGACASEGMDSEPAPQTDADTDTDIETKPTDFALAWLDDRVEVTLVGGQGPYDLGVTEAAAGGWTGEDCYLGFESNKTCHTVLGSRTTTLTFVSTPWKVADGKTYMGNADPERLTWVVADNDASVCWVFGSDPDYYAALDCIAM